MCLSFPYHPKFRTGCGTVDERADLLGLVWRPSAANIESGLALPPLTHWDAASACSVLAGRSVLVIGDSLSGEFFHTLSSTLRWDGGQAAPQQPFSESDKEIVGSTVVHNCSACTAPGQALLGLDFIAINTPGLQAAAAVAERLHNGTGENFILVVNWGAWLSNYGSSDEAAIAESMAALRKVAPDSLLFYRTTPAGHPDAIYANKTQAPPLTEPLPESYFFSGPPDWEGGVEFWPEYAQAWLAIERGQPALVKALQEQDPNLLVLDVVHPTQLRHDSHPPLDGLHYCMPGPIDFWVELFLSALQLLQ